MSTTPERNTDYRAQLQYDFAVLKPTPMFQHMASTVEASPWHREENVLVHTEMVVAEYVALTNAAVGSTGKWTRTDYLGGIAAVFHDVGKPSSEIVKTSEARGVYRAYHGHELVSARMFESWAAKMSPMFSAFEIYSISWMIEHHMPWELADKTKRIQLAMTAKWVGAEVFTRELLADQRGRIADDQAAKNERAASWVKEFLLLVDEVELPERVEQSPIMFIPVGPSGSGKSTTLTNVRDMFPTVVAFSLDALRHEFYDMDDYTVAYQQSVDDKDFQNRSNARFSSMVKECAASGTHMYIDNTNLSAKRRKSFIDAGRKHGFMPVAIVMPVALDELIKRQTTRLDKNVPESAVRQQYKSLQLPMLGEFDSIIVSPHNM